MVNSSKCDHFGDIWFKTRHIAFIVVSIMPLSCWQSQTRQIVAGILLLDELDIEQHHQFDCFQEVALLVVVEELDVDLSDFRVQHGEDAGQYIQHHVFSFHKAL